MARQTIRLSAEDNNKFLAGKPVSVRLTLSYFVDNSGLMVDNIVSVGFTKKDSIEGIILSRYLLEDLESSDEFRISISVKKLEC